MAEKFEPIDLKKVVGEKELPKKPEITPERIAKGKEEYRKRVNQMVLAAVKEHLKAVSYRAFRVGAATLEDNPRVKEGYKIEASHNFKPIRLTQFGWDKTCAEARSCSAAILDQAEYIPGIITASHHPKIGEDPEDKLHEGEAIHSCWNCRNLYRDLIKKGIMSEDTIVRFVNDDSLVYEDMNDKEVLKGVKDDPNEIVELPKLKLRNQEITEEDVAKLPYEEYPLKDFLDKYKDDPPMPGGEAIPPYEMVWSY